MGVVVFARDPLRLPTVLLDRQYHSRKTPSPETMTWKGMTGGPAFRPIAPPAANRIADSSVPLVLIKSAVVC